MDSQALNAGRAAYQNGDFTTAQAFLAQAKAPGEVNGEVDHLRGNALMRMGLYDDAAQAYGDALRDTAYGKVGALNANRGRAYLAAGKPEEAVSALTQALADPDYPTPYKAQMALGEAYEALGQPREAGAAWRNAAIDESNPNPSVALARLGGCFMQLGRPMDAIEAYRTALDFSAPAASQNAVYAELGEAYVAANRLPEASDAFTRALADGTYTPTPAQQAAMAAASNAMAAIGGRPQSDTDAMLAAAGYGASVGQGTGAIDPLDPLGSSGEFIPSPEDTGFFDISEHEIVEDARKRNQVERKKRHTGLKVVIALLIVLVCLAAAAFGLYFMGYGWPMQETVVENVFQAQTAGEDLSPYLADGLSETEAAEIEALIPAGATVTIDGVDRSMNESTVSLTATLAEGGTQNYLITLVRDGIGWKVSSVELSFDSLADSDVGSTDIAIDEDSLGTSTDDGADTTSDSTTDGDALGTTGDQLSTDADVDETQSGTGDIVTSDQAAGIVGGTDAEIQNASEGADADTSQAQ